MRCDVGTTSRMGKVPSKARRSRALSPRSLSLRLLLP